MSGASNGSSASRVQAAAHRLHGALSLATSRLRLRSASSVGKAPRVAGAPYIENRGRLEIGDDFVLSAFPVVSHLVTAPAGRILIGHDVSIGSGAAIASEAEIRIGDGVRIGRGVMILDTDFHDTKDMHAAGRSVPVVIEAGARLDDDVVVLKGARIGAGAWIGRASVVSGNIAPGVFASGVPARTARSARDGRDLGKTDERVCAVVAETFDTGRPIGPEDGPESIVRWDSLGTLRLMLALEDEFGVRFAEDSLVGVTSVAELTNVVARAVER